MQPDEVRGEHPAPALPHEHDGPTRRVAIEQVCKVVVVRRKRQVVRIVAAAQSTPTLIPEDDAMTILQPHAIDWISEPQETAVIVTWSRMENDDHGRVRVSERLPMELRPADID